MHKRYAEIRQLGVTVLIVTPSVPDSIRKVTLPFEVFCDPSRTAYRYFGLERISFWMFFNLRIIWRYIKIIISGYWPRMNEKGEDIYQLGGDFIISEDRKIIFAFRSRDPVDRPSVDLLIQHLTNLKKLRRET